MTGAATRVWFVGWLVAALMAPSAVANDGKQLLWGDTHLHTSYSFDAFLNSNLSADPDVAYRWAKGEPVIHPYNRARVQIETPLDFLVVSDHAEFLGGLREIYFNGINDPDAGVLASLRNWYAERVIRDAIDEGTGVELFTGVLPLSEDPKVAARSFGDTTNNALPIDPSVISESWREHIAITERHNDPGKFTAFVGWEWSSTPGGANLHRIVVSTADAETAAKFVPFGSTDSPYPEDLWAWLEEQETATGAEFVSIPHNSNLSKGWMFPEQTLRGDAIDADYAARRMAFEPIVEVTQIKGDSETHPRLSPDDEFSDFEEYPFYLQRGIDRYTVSAGDFARGALRRGLEFAQSIEANPYQFGMIGSTDSHSGLASPEEPNFWGKMAVDSTPETKAGFSIGGGPTGWTMSASGLAAVWAEENTRDSIMAAFQRRETYGTTGPRIRVRLHAQDGLGRLAEIGGNLDNDYQSLLDNPVPMGGELAGVTTPVLVIEAERDPKGANLDRIQVVKGWVDADGTSYERVVDVAWSDGREQVNGVLSPVTDTVDRRTGRHTDEFGAVRLTAVWADPDFEPKQRAFYYARVLQVPTARHSLLDGLSMGDDASPEGPEVIQERAYTSPVWVNP